MQLPSREKASLFLDFDGTLVDIAPRPDLVEVTDRVTGFLSDAQEALDGRLAIVSGRSLHDLTRFMPIAGMVMVGGHGAEHLQMDGTRISRDDWREAARLMAERARDEASDRLMVEAKPTGIALHFRTYPDAEPEARALARAVAVDFDDFDLQHGHSVVELRPKAASKRSAVQTLLSEAPYAGSVPVFAGDDLTDKPAMEHCRDVGGCGIWIGPEAPEFTGLQFDTPADMLTHLEKWISP